jgi:anti-sigma factor RsiW
MKNGEGSEGPMFGKDGSEKQCAAIESKLIVYLDGRAAPAERHAVEEHLSGCASCRTRAEEFRALSSVLDEFPEISPSPAFDASLRARIAAEPAPRSFWNWLPSPRLAFAVTALVVMSVWMSSGPRVITSPSVVSEAIHESKVTAESDFGMIRDLPVLENYDVVSKFDALSELSGPVAATAQEPAKETR